MTDADFLQEILTHPDDDGARLIYADWLDERSDPRGQLIRVQYELTRIRKQSARYRKLRILEADLLSKHEKRWLGPLPQWVRKWEWRRGFVDFIEISTRDFLKRASAIFRLMPIQRAFLRAGPRRMPALAACSYLPRMKSLKFHKTLMEDDGVAALVDSPHLASLESLELYYCDLTAAGARRLANASSLRSLKSLNLGMNTIGAAGVQALAASPHLAQLEVIDLAWARVQDGGVFALARSGLHKLRTLLVSNNQIGNDGVAALAGAIQFTALEKIDLSWNRIGDDGTIALAASPLLSRLRTLRLCRNQISAGGVDALISSPHWTPNTTLDLRGNRLGRKAIRRLQSEFGKGFGQFDRPFAY